ncbi:MAG TPA: TIGR03118 family protein [Flavitalea sp.]|nr:TIGR03118 family protein [Flavitalea sp.]
MKKYNLPTSMPRIPILASLLFGVFVFSGCQKLIDEFHHKKDKAPELPGNFRQINLVANVLGYNAERRDPLLINGWGIAFSSGGTAWIGSQGGGVSVVYDREGNQQLAPVAIPSPGGPTGGNPTGVVFSASNTDFMLSNGAAARFIFVGVDGILSAWNNGAGSRALLLQNNSATSAYTGLALATDAGASFLYAANFRAGTIDVFDRTFAKVGGKPFLDSHLPSGYSPFNIQAVGDKLYVAYAKVGPDGRDVKGVGLGVVNIFNTNGTFVKRFADKGSLNSPWGIAQAPASFFKNEPAQNAILIGNFGDGRINAYSIDGKFLGQLSSKGKPVTIDGLWAIMFAPSTSTIDPNRLYFAAGPNHEQDGLFGYIIKE